MTLRGSDTISEKCPYILNFFFCCCLVSNIFKLNGDQNFDVACYMKDRLATDSHISPHLDIRSFLYSPVDSNLLVIYRLKTKEILPILYTKHCKQCSLLRTSLLPDVLVYFLRFYFCVSPVIKFQLRRHI